MGFRAYFPPHHWQSHLAQWDLQAVQIGPPGSRSWVHGRSTQCPGSILQEVALAMAHSRELSTCVIAGWGMTWGLASLPGGLLGRRSLLGLKHIIALGPEDQKLVISSSAVTR